MKTFGFDSNGNIVTVTNTDEVALLCLIHTIKTNPREMPFHNDIGIPDQESVVAQVLPTYHMNIIIERFKKYFDDLKITKIEDYPKFAYQIDVTLKNGTELTRVVK